MLRNEIESGKLLFDISKYFANRAFSVRDLDITKEIPFTHGNHNISVRIYTVSGWINIHAIVTCRRCGATVAQDFSDPRKYDEAVSLVRMRFRQLAPPTCEEATKLSIVEEVMDS